MMIYVVLALFFVWLLVLTWMIFTAKKHYYNLVAKTKKEKIDEILDVLLNNDEHLMKEIENHKLDIRQILTQSKKHLQKIGMVRYNPFDRMAGEQSFVIAFLDAENNGLVANFIYTHDGLRSYAKIVKKGKGEAHNLSDEEQKAIMEAANP